MNRAVGVTLRSVTSGGQKERVPGGAGGRSRLGLVQPGLAPAGADPKRRSSGDGHPARWIRHRLAGKLIAVIEGDDLMLEISKSGTCQTELPSQPGFAADNGSWLLSP